MMALKGIRVVEFAGLAPAPYCGMILSDFGANVIRVDKAPSQVNLDRLARGKKSIAVNMKNSEGVNIVKNLCRNADVLIEPFRKGVMEKLNLGPTEVMKDNSGLIYARLTGYGQTGPYSDRAGHDINYIATSGVLSMLGRKHEKPYAPINLLADFGGGGLICALGILMALYERTMSKQGQVIDANMVEGSAYLASWLWASRDIPIWGKPRGENVLDTGAHFYETYKTSDDKHMAVGAIEPQFYKQLIQGLGLSEDVPHMDKMEEMKEMFTEIFATKTQAEWTAIFEKTDACVTPVWDHDQIQKHPHNASRKSFVTHDDGQVMPRPQPLLSRTPGQVVSVPQPMVGQHTREVLLNLGYAADKINALCQEGIIECNDFTSKL